MSGKLKLMKIGQNVQQLVQYFHTLNIQICTCTHTHVDVVHVDVHIYLQTNHFYILDDFLLLLVSCLPLATSAVSSAVSILDYRNERN